MRLIDIHHAKLITDWDKLSDGLILKCSQGSSFLDSKFKVRQAEARKRGLFIGSYHFAGKGFLDGHGKLYFIAQDPIKEADLYIANADPKKGELLILDWEIDYKDPVGWCKKFSDRVKEKTGITPWLYTNDARANAHPWPKEWKYWIARYADYTGKFYPDFKPKFKDWSIHQYTSRGKVDGIEGNVDLNYTPLSKEELLIPPTNEVNNDIVYFEVYYQNDSRWKNIKLGFGNTTIGSHGCFLTCLSMMVGITPDKVNEILKNDGGFYKDLIVSDKAAKVLGLKLLKGNSNIPGKMTDINYMPDWSPSIKEVDMSPSPGKQQHFVLRIIKDDKRSIIDPWDGKEKTINYFPFMSYRLFKK